MTIDATTINSIIYVLRCKKKIVGFVAGVIDLDNNGNVEDVYLDEEYRNKGLGKDLFQKLLDWFKLHSVKAIDVHISKGNEKVLEFYRMFGFQETGHTMKLM